MGKRLISEKDIQQAAREGLTVMSVPPDRCIVTPMARDAAAMLGIDLSTGADAVCAPTAPAATPAAATCAVDSARLVDRVVARMAGRLPAGVSAERLAVAVREAVAARMAASAGPAAGAPGLRLISAAADRHSPPRDASGAVRLTEVGEQGAGGGFRAGVLTWEKSSFPRELETDEIDIVIAGELEISAGDKTLRGGPGDMIYLPRGSAVVYTTASSVTIACVNRS